MGSIIRERKSIDYSLTFDDVAIVPGRSEITPGQVNVSTKLTEHIGLNIPIVSSAMDTVTESRMAIAMAQHGGIGVIHQYLSPEMQAEEVRKVKRYESWIIERPVTISPDETIGTAKELMQEHDISGIPVIKKGRIMGILTKRDIRFVEDDRLRVKELMTTKLITVGKGISREEAKRTLQKNKIEKLLVVDKEGGLEGLITVKDILKKEAYPEATRDQAGRLMVGAAVGIKDIARVKLLVEASVDVVVVDSAHGHSQNVVDTVRDIKRDFDVEVVAGNVVTGEGTSDLISAGADAVKVGVGAGSICTTRVVTGVGVPQISAIQDCMEVADTQEIPVISDGGIKQYGDISKAVAAGASSVMIGNLLAGTDEAPGRRVVLEGRLYKEYRGMGSETALEAKWGIGRYGRSPTGKLVPEGVEGLVDYVGPVGEVLSDMVGGLKHAMGYAGFHSISGFRRNASLVEVSPGGQREAHPSVKISKEPRNYRRTFGEL